MRVFDIIIAGAGSVGVPLSMFLSKEGFKVCVIEKNSSPGRGQNRAAIGGIRATHSDASKIKTCLKSIEIFSTWKERYGDDIGWFKGGYIFPVYEERDERLLKDLLVVQKRYGLNIRWISSDDVKEIVKGINDEDLRGATYSADDGSASPLLSINAFYFKSIEYGTVFVFNELINEVKKDEGGNFIIKTDKSTYSSRYFINAAGAHAKSVSMMVGVDVPVKPDSHPAGITEPVERFMFPMLVDIRKGENSKNFYFYQNFEGQIIFCLTPEPPIWGYDISSDSFHINEMARRMLKLIPSLESIKVRRIWKGLYPMTPDGFPIVDFDAGGIENYILAVGMCGQGFMLGPGLGWIITEILCGRRKRDDDMIVNFRLDRNYAGQEKLK
ncbi:MAG: NAD(P)/FAD-dependent oxidoreductase [Elusimicrobiales bacterium]